MATIQIPIEEYNFLKSRVAALEKKIKEYKIRLRKLEEVQNGLKTKIDDLLKLVGQLNKGVLYRVFKWKKIYKEINTI